MCTLKALELKDFNILQGEEQESEQKPLRSWGVGYRNMSYMSAREIVKLGIILSDKVAQLFY